MYVSSYLELHTTLIGWMLYGLSYEVLTKTGLFLLPFMWILWSGSAQHIAQANQIDNESHSGTKAHIFGILGGIVVALTCLMPVYEIQPTTVVYQPTPSFSNPDPAEVSAEADPSTYSQSLDPVTNNATVRVPIWWRFLLGISTGITQSIVQNLPTPGDLRQARVALSSTNISDPSVAYEYRNFIRECYIPAHKQFERMVREGSLTPSGVSAEDIDWPGSRYLATLPGGYQYCTPEDRETHGCYYSIAPDRKATAYLGEKATCADWWVAIEDKLLNLDQANESTWQNLKDKLASFKGTPDDVIRQGRVKRILNNYAATQVSSEHSSGDDSLIEWGWGVVEDVVATNKLAQTSLAQESHLNIVKQAAPMIVAILQMFAVIMLPWAMLFTAYRLSTIISLSFVLFSLTFVHALLAIAGWLDHYLTTSLFDDFSMLSWLQGDDAHVLGTAQKRLLLNIILTFAYAGVPMLWLFVMGMVGVGAGTGRKPSDLSCNHSDGRRRRCFRRRGAGRREDCRVGRGACGGPDLRGSGRREGRQKVQVVRVRTRTMKQKLRGGSEVAWDFLFLSNSRR